MALVRKLPSPIDLSVWQEPLSTGEIKEVGSRFGVSWESALVSNVNFLPGFVPGKAIPNPDFIEVVDHLLFAGDWFQVFPPTKVQPVGVQEFYAVAVCVFSDRLVPNKINDNNECLKFFSIWHSVALIFR